MQIALGVLTFLVILLVVWLGFVHFQLIKITKHYESLLADVGIKDLRSAWDVHLARIDKLFHAVQTISEAQIALGKKLQGVVQKVGFLRYNSLQEVGGDQSFAIALLDGYDTGFLINSIHSRSGTRIYAKPVDKGNSSHKLSTEEEQVIALARKG